MEKALKCLLLTTFCTLCLAESYDYDSGGPPQSYRSSEPEMEGNRLEMASHATPVSPQTDSRLLTYRGGSLADSGGKGYGHLYHRDHPIVYQRDHPMVYHKEQDHAPAVEEVNNEAPQNHDHGHGHHNHDHGTSSMSFYQKVKHHEHKFKFEQKHGKHGSWHGYAHPHAYGGLKAW